MKTFILTLTFTTMMSTQLMAGIMKPENIADVVLFSSASPVITSSCLFAGKEWTIEGEVVTNTACNVASTTMAGVSSTILLKEVKAVQADALLYVSGESATPALVSLVDRIQKEADLKGQNLSFDEIIDIINTVK